MRSSSSSRALAALAIFFLASVSTAEASRIGFDFGDRGLIIWDGQNDVGSMNAPIKATVAGDLGITTASQLVVDLSVINTGPLGDGIVDGPRAYLMVSGPDAAGQKTLYEALCPGLDPNVDPPCQELIKATANTIIDDAYATTQRLIAFIALLDFNGTSEFRLNPNDFAAFNAILPQVTNLSHRFALLGSVNSQPNDDQEEAVFAVRDLRVPEPASIMLFGVAALGALRRWRRA